MYNYVWPVLIIISANLLFQSCAKSIPESLNLFAALTVVFLVGTIISFVAYYASTGGSNIVLECSKCNWAPVLMGAALVVLEAGFVMAFRNGWPLSLLQIFQTSLLAVLLVAVGYLVFHEPITWQKALGIFIVLSGMGILAWK